MVLLVTWSGRLLCLVMSRLVMPCHVVSCHTSIRFLAVVDLFSIGPFPMLLSRLPLGTVGLPTPPTSPCHDAESSNPTNTLAFLRMRFCASLNQLSHEDTRIVSLTVTEKGYCQDVNGDLDRVSAVSVKSGLSEAMPLSRLHQENLGRRHPHSCRGVVLQD